MNGRKCRELCLGAMVLSLLFSVGCSSAGNVSINAPAQSISVMQSAGVNGSASGGGYVIPEMRLVVFHADLAVGTDNFKADLSQLAQGVVVVQAYDEKRLKFQIVCGEEKYNYDLPGDGSTVIYPLNMGDGAYTFRLMEQVEGTKYACIWSETRDVVMDDEFQPFLRPNQFVPYDEDSACVQTAHSVAASCATDSDVAAAVYDLLVESIGYDQQKADTIQNGYIPDPDDTLTSGKGICFDYASLAAAMLRSVGIPCKLITGYVNQSTYHAWNSFYLQNEGWVTAEFRLSAHRWQRVDITFAAGGMPASEMMADAEYTVRYVY